MELFGLNFFIPAYQRGYRWTVQQVQDLLDDINAFSALASGEDDNMSWYCLQPIVVKKKELAGETDDNFLSELKKISSTENEVDAINSTKLLLERYEKWKKWEVVDGQQRLTTIFLILSYLEERFFWGMEYETRKGSEEYLKNNRYKIGDDSSNIDYYHISIAYRTINEWFANTRADINEFKTKLYNDVKVIWYEVFSGDAIDIFTRINVGKIPLTNAELIKALFLNGSNFINADSEKIRLKQLEIASEWDRMEYALQDDAFWYFLNNTNENPLATRIEFIFNLIAKENGNHDERYTFSYFSKKFKDSSEKGIEAHWSDIKNVYQILEEWFTDRELYHKVGYLIAAGTSVKTLHTFGSDTDRKERLSKSDFRKKLDEMICSTINSNKSIDELLYGSDNSTISSVLLLHNVISTLNSTDVSLRFPFDKFKNKTDSWSLEHIHAQNSKEITEVGDFKIWVENIQSELSNELEGKIRTCIDNKDQSAIPNLIFEIGNLFGDFDVHSIENMALLSKSHNSKLNNGLFPTKRRRIIQLEKEGAFIPICTRKIFQKSFDGCSGQIIKWEEEDRKAYRADIDDTLKNYLSQQTNTNDQ